MYNFSMKKISAGLAVVGFLFASFLGLIFDVKNPDSVRLVESFVGIVPVLFLMSLSFGILAVWRERGVK